MQEDKLSWISEWENTHDELETYLGVRERNIYQWQAAYDDKKGSKTNCKPERQDTTAKHEWKSARGTRLRSSLANIGKREVKCVKDR